MSGLLEELGLDPDSLSWHDLALCKGMEREWFYSDYENDAEIAKAVDEGCLRCPVFHECFNQGAMEGEWGVWGGVYWDGTGKPSTKRNQHKTEEVWAKIKERYIASGD